jgi:hypothetical protein
MCLDGTRGWSCRIPRIDDREAAAFEPAVVTRDHTCVVGSRDRGDHEIDCRCRSPCPPAGGEDIGIGDGGIHVERQHASFEILQEHGPCRCFEIEPTAALRRDRKPGQDFCLADTEVVKRRSVGCPAIHAATWGTACVLIIADRTVVLSMTALLKHIQTLFKNRAQLHLMNQSPSPVRTAFCLALFSAISIRSR